MLKRMVTEGCTAGTLTIIAKFKYSTQLGLRKKDLPNNAI